ncbi:ATP-binding cassette domain-containing protein [Microvirga sp. HBU67558]|uniref:ABC transporter ATP-binding protein n=1 Tax=Microvirga TaxID=186650 RepID=UPI001B367245|nr:MULTISPECIES: ABC transporter ATP-binding protein [unclassified Microvirga]MBQ0824541.1 ATP-binding cassette domain-containing protein [Microvirga sp. HBU67558]
MTALAIDNLSHGFGTRRALSEVNLSVEPGSFAVLLGPNGAGKTTLIALATGLYNAQHGDIRIFGHSIRRDPIRALARLGVVFQMPTLDLDLTVSQNMAYHGALHGLSRGEARERAGEELGRFGINDRRDDKVRSLSGGLRRRVEIARALLHRPKLLIVDEATAGLDIAARQLLLSHVRSLCRGGLSVLWATHMLGEVEPSDRLVILHQGTVRWDGRAGDLAPNEGLEAAFLRITGGPS